jgi:hypothetical protein
MNAIQSPRPYDIRPQDRRAVADLEHLARLLDSQWQIPGTGIRVGIDAIASLVPGLGDVATGLVSVYIVMRAAKLGVPKRVMARMIGNIIFDTVVGSVPVLGSIFDVFYRANNRNMRLLRRHLEKTGRSVLIRP